MSRLRIEHLSVAFGGVTAADDVCFAVGPGELVSLIGPNGAGKTTILDVLSGFCRPDAGRVLFGECELTRLAPHRIAALGIARTFQNPALFEGASVLENVLAGGHRHRRHGFAAELLGLPAVRRAERQARERAEALLAHFGIEAHAGLMIGQLPYGQRKLVELARALACEPRLLLLDEPSSGLSAPETAQMAQWIATLRAASATAVLMVEHDMGLVARVSQRVVALDAGRVIAQGTPARIRSDPAVIEAYLGA